MDVARIRLATTDDIADLAELRWHLYTEDQPADTETGVAYAERFERFARDALRNPDWRIWVADTTEGMVGSMWRFRVPRVPQPDRGETAPLAYLTNVYVRPAHREAGLGSRMLHEVIDVSRAEGFSLIMVWPSDRSQPFYGRAGFERLNDPLVLDLRDESSDRASS